MRERQVPLGINTAVGAVTVVVCCLAPGGLDAQGRDARLAVLTLGVAVFAATVGDLAAVAVTAGVAFLLFDGFVEGRYGDLVWTGRADVVHVALLYAAGLTGLVLGAAHRSRHRRRGGGPLPVVPGQRRVSGWSAPEQRVRNAAGR
jgi:hypothetical protein